MALDSVMKRFGTLRRTMTKKLSGESKEPTKPPMPQSRTAQLRLANTFDTETEVTTCTSYTPNTGRKALNKSTESVKAMGESRDNVQSNEGSDSNINKPKPKPRPQARPDRPGSAALISNITPVDKADSEVKEISDVLSNKVTTAVDNKEVPTASTSESKDLADKAPARPPKKPSQKPPPPARKRGNTMGPSSIANSNGNNSQGSADSKTRFTAGTMPGRPTNAPKTRASASSVFGPTTATTSATGCQDKVPSRPPPKSVGCEALRAKVDDLKEKAECYNISIGKELRGIRSLSTSGVNGLTVEDNRLRKIHAATLALGKLAEQFNATVTGDLDRCVRSGSKLKDSTDQTVSPKDVAKELLEVWRTCFMGLEFVHSLEHKTTNMSDQRGEIAYKELMLVFGENTRLPDSLL